LDEAAADFWPGLPVLRGCERRRLSIFSDFIGALKYFEIIDYKLKIIEYLSDYQKHNKT